MLQWFAMKTIINKIKPHLEENVTFNIYKMTPFMQNIVDMVLSSKPTTFFIAQDLTANKQRKIFHHEIFYIEHINRKTFIYLQKGVYEIKMPLYKAEKELPNYFERCSKSMIVNTCQIQTFFSSLSGNLTAKLTNNEKVTISRRYVKSIKSTLYAI